MIQIFLICVKVISLMMDFAFLSYPPLCEFCPCNRSASDVMDIRKEWIKDCHCFLTLHHPSLNCFVSFLVWKRKITQSMTCQHEIHFAPYPLELQWNCEIMVFNNISLMAFESGTKKSIKSHFFRITSLLFFHIFSVGCLAICHTSTHNQADSSHTVL